jgi:hypothetical protein
MLGIRLARLGLEVEKVMRLGSKPIHSELETSALEARLLDGLPHPCRREFTDDPPHPPHNPLWMR